MTGKRLKKLIMGRGFCRNFAEYVRRLPFTEAFGEPMSNAEKYRMVKSWIRCK